METGEAKIQMKVCYKTQDPSHIGTIKSIMEDKCRVLWRGVSERGTRYETETVTCIDELVKAEKTV